MNCDRGFWQSFSVWTVPVCLLRIRGELAIGAHLRATDLYTVGSFDPDHDAVMRIGVGLQPTGLDPWGSSGRRAHSVGRHQVPCSNTASNTASRHLGSSIRESAEKPARGRMVLSGMLVPVR